MAPRLSLSPEQSRDLRALFDRACRDMSGEAIESMAATQAAYLEGRDLPPLAQHQRAFPAAVLGPEGRGHGLPRPAAERVAANLGCRECLEALVAACGVRGLSCPPVLAQRLAAEPGVQLLDPGRRSTTEE